MLTIPNAFPTTPEIVRRLHDEWAERQRPDAPAFGGPDGKLYFAEDGEFWQAVEAALGRLNVSRLAPDVRPREARDAR